jgi:predicted aminopeptidase
MLRQLTASTRIIVLIGLACWSTGCQTASYYSQAVRGHLQVLQRQHSITRVLADPESPERLKTRLRLVLELRQYAECELHLPAHGHYLKYADLGRKYVVWNVHAAPEFSLKSKSWWYPIVGRLTYRGFFNETQARACADDLKRRGLEVSVGGVQAYSTLGWFRDPVLSTFVFDTDDDLAELLFHELAHQRLFVPGDTDFNEAFATAVAEEGLRRWLTSKGDTETLEKMHVENQRKDQFLRIVADARERLEKLYLQAKLESSRGSSSKAAVAADPEALRHAKQRIIDDLRAQHETLKAQWGGKSDFEGWFGKDINNARINSVDTYYRLVPAFHAMLKCRHGELDKFFADVAAMGRLRKTERHRQLNTLLAAP